MKQICKSNMWRWTTFATGNKYCRYVVSQSVKT